MNAQKRYNLACAIYSNTEKEYGYIESIKSKLAKVQNNANTCSQKIDQIWAIFHLLDSEFKDYMQDQNVNDIQVLKSTSCDNKPLMDTTQINQLSNILIKGQENVDSLFTQNYNLNFMCHVIGEVTKEMQKIRTLMDKFKKVEILESCMKALKQGLLDALMLFNEEQTKVTRQQNVKNS